MFGWLRRRKKKKTDKRRTTSTTQNRNRARNFDTGKFMKTGDLILKQKIKTPEGVEEVYVQPVKLEVPNMVTIGGKLDTIIEKLDKKPDKEWFETEYIETLKSILKVTETIKYSQSKEKNQKFKEQKTEHENKIIHETKKQIEKIEKEAASILIVNVLKKTKKKTISEISKEIGASRVTIWRNIKRLEKQGKIKVIRDGKCRYVSLV
jgi:uncharacterized membrane protein